MIEFISTGVIAIYILSIIIYFFGVVLKEESEYYGDKIEYIKLPFKTYKTAYNLNPKKYSQYNPHCIGAAYDYTDDKGKTRTKYIYFNYIDTYRFIMFRSKYNKRKKKEDLYEDQSDFLNELKRDIDNFNATKKEERDELLKDIELDKILASEKLTRHKDEAVTSVIKEINGDKTVDPKVVENIAVRIAKIKDDPDYKMYNKLQKARDQFRVVANAPEIQIPKPDGSHLINRNTPIARYASIKAYHDKFNETDATYEYYRDHMFEQVLQKYMRNAYFDINEKITERKDKIDLSNAIIAVYFSSIIEAARKEYQKAGIDISRDSVPYTIIDMTIHITRVLCDTKDSVNTMKFGNNIEIKSSSIKKVALDDETMSFSVNRLRGMRRYIEDNISINRGNFLEAISKIPEFDIQCDIEYKALKLKTDHAYNMRKNERN